MVVPCPICGKLTAIYWPQFWVYRRGETYYCSENCLIVDRTRDVRLMNQVARERLIRKGVEDMGHHKLTLEQKKKAVEIASQGGDQLEYLRKCGAKNPSAAWFYIKKKMTEKIKNEVMAMPQIKAQAPAEETAEKPILAEVAEKVPEVEAVVMTRKEHEEAHRPIKTIEKIIDWEGKEKRNKLEITELKSKVLPNFRYKKVKNDDKDFMVLNGYGFTNEESVIPLGREGWSQLIDEIRTALDQMNI